MAANNYNYIITDQTKDLTTGGYEQSGRQRDYNAKEHFQQPLAIHKRSDLMTTSNNIENVKEKWVENKLEKKSPSYYREVDV